MPRPSRAEPIPDPRSAEGRNRGRSSPEGYDNESDLARDNDDVAEDRPRVHVLALGHPDEIAWLDRTKPIGGNDLPGERARHANLAHGGAFRVAAGKVDVFAHHALGHVLHQAGMTHGTLQ